MQLNFRGMALSQKVNPANGRYPETANITFLEKVKGGDNKQFNVQSTVILTEESLMIEREFTLGGVEFQTVKYTDKKTQLPREFTKISATTLSGK